MKNHGVKMGRIAALLAVLSLAPAAAEAAKTVVHLKLHNAWKMAKTATKHLPVKERQMVRAHIESILRSAADSSLTKVEFTKDAASVDEGNRRLKIGRQSGELQTWGEGAYAKEVRWSIGNSFDRRRRVGIIEGDVNSSGETTKQTIRTYLVGRGGKATPVSNSTRLITPTKTGVE